MKKTIVTSLLALTVIGGAFAQGTVNWGSGAIAGNTFTAQTNSVNYSPLFGGAATGLGAGAAVGATATTATGFYYAMLYTNQPLAGTAISAPGSLAALNGWSSAGLSATNSTSTAGRILTSGQGSANTVPWANGSTNYIMMVGWSANLGTSWSAADATISSPSLLGNVVGPAYFGMSSIGYINPGTSTTLGVNAFASSSTGVAYGVPIFSLNTQLYLIPVPEPGTMALAALGGASLLLFRRRK